MEYGTYEQWMTIQENVINSNWTDAAKNCIEYSFFAHDLIDALENEECPLIEATDLVILVEMAQKARGNMKTVILKTSKNEWKTSVNGKVSDEEIKKYFLGNYFDMGGVDKEDMQQVISVVIR